MAEVIREASKRDLFGQKYTTAEALAAALSAAGFGPVQVAKEAAWAEGFAAGKSRAMRHMSDEPNLSLNVANPYRATP